MTPRVFASGNLGTFWGAARDAVRFIAAEREVIVFALAQWAVIALAYMIWIQVLDWIPADVWREVARGEDGAPSGLSDDRVAILNLAVLGWTVMILAIASYFTSILSACIVNAYVFAFKGWVSTPEECLRASMPYVPRLWLFTFVDAWFTVGAIVGRLPQRRRRRSVVDEALYHAWKVGSAGVYPALVTGQTLAASAALSLKMLASHPWTVVKLRMGYSLACWMVGIATYVLAVAALARYADIKTWGNFVYNFYLLMSIPVIAAAGVVSVLLRPLYLIACTCLYCETQANSGEASKDAPGAALAVAGGDVKSPPAASVSLQVAHWAMVFVIAFLLSLLVMFSLFGAPSAESIVSLIR